MPTFFKCLFAPFMKVLIEITLDDNVIQIGLVRFVSNVAHFKSVYPLQTQHESTQKQLLSVFNS